MPSAQTSIIRLENDQSKADRLLNSTYIKTQNFVLNKYLLFQRRRYGIITGDGR